MEWNLQIAMGEMLGSFILTFGVMMTLTIIGRKSFGLQTKWQKKLFQVLAIFALVVVAITAARGFGAPGFINPGIKLMMSVWNQQFTKDFLLIVGFDFLGGIISAIVYLLFKKLYNSYQEHPEKIDIAKIFTYNKQHPIKNIGMETIANIFWYLPVAAYILLQLRAETVMGGDGANLPVGEFLVPIIAGFSIVATLLLTTEIGVANLNPQVWLGELILKLTGAKWRITKKAFFGELTSVGASFSVAALCGLMAWGIIPPK